jgi:hypothetical protein
LGDGSEGLAVEVVKLRATAALGCDKAGVLQNRQVLRDGLSRRADSVPGQQHRAQLEERLAVASCEFIEDEPPGLVVEGLEDRGHPLSIGKSLLAYQGSADAA